MLQATYKKTKKKSSDNIFQVAEYFTMYMGKENNWNEKNQTKQQNKPTK